MASNGSLSGLPDAGWQQRALPVLAGLAREDARISDLRMHGSASGTTASTDRWSDLDLIVTAADPAVVAEDFARQIGRRLSPVFADSRSGDSRPRRRDHPSPLRWQPLGRVGVPAGPAPGPYSPAGITAAIRFYITTGTDIAVNWDPPPQRDHSPLLELLDAVDLHGAAQ